MSARRQMMGHLDAVVQAVCRLPLDMHVGNVSASELLRRSDYGSVRSLVTGDGIVECLDQHPEWVSAWFGWSDDKRTDQGWYLKETKPDEFLVGYYQGPNSLPPTKFESKVRACAAFVLREIDGIAQSSL